MKTEILFLLGMACCFPQVVLFVDWIQLLWYLILSLVYLLLMQSFCGHPEEFPQPITGSEEHFPFRGLERGYQMHKPSPGKQGALEGMKRRLRQYLDAGRRPVYEFRAGQVY